MSRLEPPGGDQAGTAKRARNWSQMPRNELGRDARAGAARASGAVP